jgi:hypothetical protein
MSTTAEGRHPMTAQGGSYNTGGDDTTLFVLGLIIDAAIAIPLLVATYFILRKAGYSGWCVLLAAVPVVNVVCFFVFAFQKWPAIKELEWRRSTAAAFPPPPPPPWS